MTRSQTTPSSSQIITLERLLSEREDEIARLRDDNSMMGRDAQRYNWLRNCALDWYVGPEYSTHNDVVCSGDYRNFAGAGVALDSTIDAILTAAPNPGGE